MDCSSRAQRANLVDVTRSGPLPLLLILLLALCLVVIPAPAQQATPVRVADAPCARCHAALFQSYLATPMANASGAAQDKLHADTFVHAPSSMQYAIATGHDHDQPALSYRSLKTPGLAGHFPLEYFLGSGHLGITYLYSINNFLFESPVAWYGPTKTYDMKPGLAAMDRMPPPLPMQSGCLRCHMSSVQPSDAGTLNRYQGAAFLHTGITCEACHGDASAHLRSGGKADLVNPARLSAEARDSVCISCHLEGDVLVERAGHSALDYRPGDAISTYLAFYVKSGANATRRGVSEVEQLSQSTCKRASGDRMACTSCHDAHYTPAEREKAAFFRTKCLACHNRPQFAQTHHPENKDCTACHMPRTGADNIPHVAWTDHRILKLPEPPSSQQTSSKPARSEGSAALTPIFSPGVTARDLAMANYQALLEGDTAREPIAWQQLNGQLDTLGNDVAALDALGNLDAERGNTQAAEQAFRRVLTLAPDDLAALSNLGVLSAKQGKLNEAIALLERAFSRNQDLPGLSKNLAHVQCMAGDGPAARATLQATLAFGSNLEDVRELLAQMDNCRPLPAP